MERVQKAREQIEMLIGKFLGTAEGRRLKYDYLAAKAEYVNCLKQNFLSQYMAEGSAVDIAKVCIGEKGKMEDLERELFEKHHK